MEVSRAIERKSVQNQRCVTMTNREAIELVTRFRDAFVAISHPAFDAMTMAISALRKQEEDRWVPVTESKPTETGLYLVTENAVVERKWTTRIRIAKCEVSKLYDGRVDVCWRGYGGHVIAWRPLPELFQVEEE